MGYLTVGLYFTAFLVVLYGALGGALLMGFHLVSIGWGIFGVLLALIWAALGFSLLAWLMDKAH